MEIGGVRFMLDPAAVSAIRYRAEYGESIVNGLADCETDLDTERKLLRMCWMMIPPANRPELPQFVKLVRKDKQFFSKANVARAALLSTDYQTPTAPESSPGGEKFDEYKVLALMACSGVDFGLIYELPIFHLLSVIRRVSQLQDPDITQYRQATDQEMAQLYPRRKKKHG